MTLYIVFDKALCIQVHICCDYHDTPSTLYHSTLHARLLSLSKMKTFKDTHHLDKTRLDHTNLNCESCVRLYTAVAVTRFSS